MMRTRLFLPVLLGAALGAQAPATPQAETPGQTQAPPQAAPQALPPAPVPGPRLRAEYGWGYASAEGSGKGTLTVLLDPATGQAILELMGLGERLLYLRGDSAAGYQVEIPRQKLSVKTATLGAVPLPFLPELGSVDRLYRMLTDGSGPGVKVLRKDAKGPLKMRYDGVDAKGREFTVWLDRTRWEPGT
jgi:hypothetical protein